MIKKESINELKNKVFDGDENAVDSWFKKMNLNNLELNFLAKEIVNYTYFYVFSSQTTNKETIEKEEFRRYAMIFKHFDLPEQLVLMNGDLYQEFNVKYFKLLKYSEQNKKDRILLKKSNVLFNITLTLFNKEKFKELHEIEDFLQIKVLDKNYLRAAVKYQDKNVSGSFGITLKNKIFKPHYDIIFNFTEIKKDYLITQKIKLPSRKETMELIKEMINEMKNSEYAKSYENYIPNMINNSSLYIKNMELYNLNKKLHQDLIEKGTKNNNKL